jgi:hypothetical protein
MPDHTPAPRLCCDDLASAYAVTFLNPLRDEEDWLAYGTDFDSVSAGAPEIRFWPVRFCPFCGARLPRLAGAATPPRPRAT